MSEKLNLTAPQYKALKKWADGKPGNEVAYRVRSDVYDRLRSMGFLTSYGLLQRKITEKGLAALKSFDDRRDAK